MLSTPATTAPAGTARPPVGEGEPPGGASRAPGGEATGRLVGVDLTRGIAVLGMIAVHVFGTLNREGGPTAAQAVAGGRSATTFALVAGLSLAFLSGGRRGVRPGTGAVAAAGIAARGLAIGLIGLTLAYLGSADVILSSYGLMFLLVIPLVWAGPRLLTGVAVLAGCLGPVLVLAATGSSWGSLGLSGDPTLTSLLTEPLAVLMALLVTGAYPVVVYLAYLSAGLAVGRLDLTSPRLAWRLLLGGLFLAVAAQGLSAYLLTALGGMSRLQSLVQADEAGADGAGGVETDAGDGGLDPGGGPATDTATDFQASEATDLLRWDPHPVDSWWYLALPSPHAHTPLDVAHTLGGALALLGFALLVCRIGVVARLVRPLADIGAMPLTIYSAHLIVLATPLLERRPRALFVAMSVAAVVFAVVWRRLAGQGPMERLLAAVARAARGAAARRSGRAAPIRPGPCADPGPSVGPEPIRTGPSVPAPPDPPKADP